MTTLNDTVETAKDAAKSTLDSARSTIDSARSTLESARGETQHAASTVFSTLKEGVGVAASTLALIRSLELSDALGWIGLARRRGPFESIAMFGSGVLVGAGLGVLFAPMSGAELRGTLLSRMRGAQKKVEEKAGAIEHQAEDLAHKAKATIVNAAKDVVEDAGSQAGDLAHKAKDAVNVAERKAKSATDSAERKAEDLADKAKDVIRNVERKADEMTVKIAESNGGSRVYRAH